MRGRERMDLGRLKDTPFPLLLLCPCVLAPPPEGGQGTRKGKNISVLLSHWCFRDPR